VAKYNLGATDEEVAAAETELRALVTSLGSKIAEDYSVEDFTAAASDNAVPTVAATVASTSISNGTAFDVTFTFTKSGTTTKFDPDGFGIDNIKLSDGKFVLSYVDESNTVVKYADESDTVGYVEDLVRVSQGVYKATIVPTNALGNVLVSLDSYWSDENGNSGGFTSLDLNAGYTMSIQTALDAISAYADQNFLPYGTDDMRIAIANATSINSSVSAKGYLNGVTISDPGQGLALADVNLLAAAGAKIEGTTDTLLLSAGDLGVSEVPDTVTYEDEDGHPVTVEFFPTLNKIALQSRLAKMAAMGTLIKHSKQDQS
jgi:hypothetical protein